MIAVAARAASIKSVVSSRSFSGSRIDYPSFDNRGNPLVFRRAMRSTSSPTCLKSTRKSLKQSIRIAEVMTARRQMGIDRRAPRRTRCGMIPSPANETAGGSAALGLGDR